MFSRNGLWCWAVLLGSLVLVSAVVGDDPSADSCKPGQLTVSKQTTYFTEPLREDGTVDYIAALNAKHSQGVTPENNAAVLLVRALGPAFISDKALGEVLERVGIGDLPEDGNYFDASSEEHGLETSADWYPFWCRAWSEQENPELAAWLERNAEPPRAFQAGERAQSLFCTSCRQ